MDEQDKKGKWLEGEVESRGFFWMGEMIFFFDDGDDLINWGIDHVGEKRELL